MTIKMHDTTQLVLACSKDKHMSKKKFLGVFAADKILFPIPYFCCFIVNTEKYGQPGEHWVCVFCNRKKNYLVRMTETKFMVTKMGKK